MVVLETDVVAFSFQMEPVGDLCGGCQPRAYFGIAHKSYYRVVGCTENAPDANGIIHDPIFHDESCPFGQPPNLMQQNP